MALKTIRFFYSVTFLPCPMEANRETVSSDCARSATLAGDLIALRAEIVVADKDQIIAVDDRRTSAIAEHLFHLIGLQAGNLSNVFSAIGGDATAKLEPMRIFDGHCRTAFKAAINAGHADRQ